MPRHPRRAVAALATGLAAIGVAIGSGAEFTAQSVNAAVMFSAGTLTIANSHEGGAFLDLGQMSPGAEPKKGVVDIENSGNIAGDFSVSSWLIDPADGGEPSPGPLAERIRLRVIDCGEFDGDAAPACGDADDSVEHDGTLAGLEDAADLARFSSLERHRYEFTTWLDAATGPEYQGDRVLAAFVWDAVEANR